MHNQFKFKIETTRGKNEIRVIAKKTQLFEKLLIKVDPNHGFYAPSYLPIEDKYHGLDCEIWLNKKEYSKFQNTVDTYNQKVELTNDMLNKINSSLQDFLNE